MKLKLGITAILAILFLKINAQEISIDSLRKQVVTAKEDTIKIKALQDLGLRLLFYKPDTSLILYRQGLALARDKKLLRYEASLLSYIGGALSFFPGKQDSVLLIMRQAMTLANENKFREEEARCYQVLSATYLFNWKDTSTALAVLNDGLDLAKKYQLRTKRFEMTTMLSYWYSIANKTDSALFVCLNGIINSKTDNVQGDELDYRIPIRSAIFGIQSLDEMKHITEKGIKWAKSQHDKKFETYFIKTQAENYNRFGQAPQALASYIQALEMSKNLKDNLEVASILYEIGRIYMTQEEYKQSLSYFLKCLDIQEGIPRSNKMYTYEMIGNSYARLKTTDSAIHFAKKSYEEAERIGNGYVEGGILNDLGELYATLGQDSLAMNYFRMSLPEILSNRTDFLNECIIYTGMAKLFKTAGQTDSSVYYARKAIPLAQRVYAYDYLYDAASLMIVFFRNIHKADSAFYYQDMAIAAKDSLFNQNKIKAIQNIEINEQIRQQQVKEDEIRYQNRINTYIMLGGLAIVILVAGILYRNNRQKQKVNVLLVHQKEKVESTLAELKSTQSQLIQSEKMASLGELTAGIAHEIQNPLNFVNNFSEVSKELLDEMKTELNNGNTADAKNIADDVIQNLEKINHHGKRADAIVKGMLQHSQASKGRKEPTDINKLADEYLRLSYHGLRSKDKLFNATPQTDFDESIGNINIIPQDIGRALLNLYNNAFYAVSEKKKLQAENYEPTVSVSTKKIGDKVLISIRDNGNGISQKNVDKIFQPFFTTKPTGQGTGLGLSLAYDIMKAHGGEIKVDSKEGEGSEFIIALPLV